MMSLGIVANPEVPFPFPHIFYDEYHIVPSKIEHILGANAEAKGGADHVRNWV